MAVSKVQVTLNGTTYTLAFNAGTGKYEGQLTAPGKSSYSLSGKYYPVTVKATDSAGNSTTVGVSDAALGASLQLKVRETVKPVIAITAPTESQKLTNNKPTVSWTVTDDDSGVNAATIGITIDSGSKITGGITKTAVTGGYQCSYAISTALADGSHTIKIDGSDNDGNAATQRTVNFVVDTVPPVLSVTSPANNLITNQTAVTVAGNTNDATSSPVALTVKLNSETAQSVTVGSSGAFSKALTLAAGENTITIVARDGAGKTSTITRKVTLDTSAPVIGAVTLSPNPVSTGEVLTISVTVTD